MGTPEAECSSSGRGGAPDVVAPPAQWGHPTCDRLGCSGRSAQLGSGCIDREASVLAEHAMTLAQHSDRVGEKEEHDRQRNGGERPFSERRSSALPQDDVRSGSAFACELDHLLAVARAPVATASPGGRPPPQPTSSDDHPARARASRGSRPARSRAHPRRRRSPDARAARATRSVSQSSNASSVRQLSRHAARSSQPRPNARSASS